MAADGINSCVDAVGESGRNPVSEHQIQPGCVLYQVDSTVVCFIFYPRLLGGGVGSTCSSSVFDLLTKLEQKLGSGVKLASFYFTNKSSKK